MNLITLKNILQELQIKPNRQLGQNFLINEELAFKMASCVKATVSPWVEIGPGVGALTQFFNSHKKQMFLIERDKKLAAYWAKKGFVIFCEDALKFNWNQIPYPFSLFGNLPYQIAGSLILEMSLLKRNPNQMILMVQKEVANRILAKTHTKSYGLLSVISQVFWEIKPVCYVSKNNFYPKPEVDGRVLSFQAKTSKEISQASSFLKFVKRCFAHRRKKLPKDVGLTSDDLNSNRRAEELSPTQYVRLFKNSHF